MNYWMYQLQQKALNREEVATEASIINWWAELTLNDFNAILQNFIPEFPDDIAAIVPLTSQKDEEYWKSNIKTWLATTTAGEVEPSSFDLVPLELNVELTSRGYKELPSDILGARVFRLSNGLQVILKEVPRTVSQERTIHIQGFRKKGALNFPKETYYPAMFSPYIIRNAGIGNLNKFQLQNLISGSSIAYIKPYVADTEIGIRGTSGEKDLENLFQIVHQYISVPRKDSIAFQDWQIKEWEGFLYPKIGKINSDFR